MRLLPTSAPRKRRRTDAAQKDASGYIQLSYASTSFGKSLRRQEYLNRMVESNIVSFVDRYQNMSPTGGANGAFWLSNNLSGTAPARTRLLPLYSFELNSLRYNVSSPSTASGAQPFYAYPFLRMRHSESSNALNFISTNMNGYLPDGTTADTTNNKLWQEEIKPYNALAENAPYEYAMVDWVEVVLPIWGATTNPSSVTVTVARFTDEDLCPIGVGYDPSIPGNYVSWPEPAPTEPQAFDKFQRFWHGKVDNTNGCYTKKVSWKNMPGGMRVLKQQRFDFNPTANFENDTAGHQKIFRMFLKLNEFTSYVGQDDRANGGAATATVASGGNVNTWPVSSVVTQQLVHCSNKKARLFLFVHAQNATVDAGDVATQAPSFDIMVRRKISIIA